MCAQGFVYKLKVQRILIPYLCEEGGLVPVV